MGEKDTDPPIFAKQKAEPKEVHLAWMTDSALLPVDREPHPALKKPGDRGHHAITGAGATDEHVTVVRMPHKPVSPPRQFLIQFVEDNTGQERRERASLRGAFQGFDPRVVRHHDLCLQHPTHQTNHPAIRNLPGHAVKKALMMDTIEKFLQIEVHDRSVASFKMCLCFCNGRCCTALGTEAVAAWMKAWLEHRLQNLKRGLLHNPVDHVRNAETPLPASGLGDVNPEDVSGPISAFQQVTAQTADKLWRNGLCLFDRLPINARCALVTHYVDKRRS